MDLFTSSARMELITGNASAAPNVADNSISGAFFQAPLSGASYISVHPKSFFDWSNLDGFSFRFKSLSNAEFNLCVRLIERDTSPNPLPPAERPSISGCTRILVNRAGAGGEITIGFPTYNPYNWLSYLFRVADNDPTPDRTTHVLRTGYYRVPDSCNPTQSRAHCEIPEKFWQANLRQIEFIQFSVNSVSISGRSPRNLPVKLDQFAFRRFVPYCAGQVDHFGQLKEITANQTANGSGNAFTQLAARAQNEYAPVNQARPADWDAFGGLAGLASPGLTQVRGRSGHFRVGKLADRWWFITPENHLFFSMGVNSVDFTHHLTPVFGRESLFIDPPGGPNSSNASYRQNGDGAFNFYQNNLQNFTTGGQPYPLAWANRALNRMNAWGFNTVGNWSDERVTYAATPTAPAIRLPYVTAPNTRTFPAVPSDCTADVVNDTSRCPRWLMTQGLAARLINVIYVVDKKKKVHVYPDVFQVSYANYINDLLSAYNAQSNINNDPYCIGFFVDNEINWNAGGNEADYLLAKSIYTATQGTAHDAFLSYVGGWKPLPNMTDNDWRNLTGYFAGKYYQTVKEARDRNLPNKLYLGSRFGFGNYPKVVIDSARSWVDVLTFNVNRAPEEMRDASLTDYANTNVSGNQVAESAERPILISEFQFSDKTETRAFSDGRVEMTGGWTRGDIYPRYMELAIRNKSLVGAHWYKYFDNPPAGRVGEFENFANGLVSVLDFPYQLTVQPMRSYNHCLYKRLYRAWFQVHAPATLPACDVYAMP